MTSLAHNMNPDNCTNLIRTKNLFVIVRKKTDRGKGIRPSLHGQTWKPSPDRTGRKFLASTHRTTVPEVPPSETLSTQLGIPAQPATTSTVRYRYASKLKPFQTRIEQFFNPLQPQNLCLCLASVLSSLKVCSKKVCSKRIRNSSCFQNSHNGLDS